MVSAKWSLIVIISGTFLKIWLLVKGLFQQIQSLVPLHVQVSKLLLMKDESFVWQLHCHCQVCVWWATTIHFLYLLNPIQGSKRLEPIPAAIRREAEQVASPSQGQHRDKWINNHNRSCSLLRSILEWPINPLLHGENMHNLHRKAPAKIRIRNLLAVRR